MEIASDITKHQINLIVSVSKHAIFNSLHQNNNNSNELLLLYYYCYFSIRLLGLMDLYC